MTEACSTRRLSDSGFGLADRLQESARSSWREALSPAVSPTPSLCSPTPPPSSPSNNALLSERSIGSNTSSRSGGRGRSMSASASHPSIFEAPRSMSSGSGALASSRSSVYGTPNSSARISEFGSTYDTSSLCGSARNVDLSSVYENEPALSSASFPSDAPQKVPSRKKQTAYAAAFETFAPAPRSEESSLAGTFSENQKASVDPKQVFSAARHGRHKEVEASLAAGFDPCYADSYGNSLFHIACQNGNKRIAKLAIKYGGDMDGQNLKGNTGVHFLFSYGYAEIGEYFIEKGASGTILNAGGNNPRQGIK